MHAYLHLPGCWETWSVYMTHNLLQLAIIDLHCSAWSYRYCMVLFSLRTYINVGTGMFVARIFFLTTTFPAPFSFPVYVEALNHQFLLWFTLCPLLLCDRVRSGWRVDVEWSRCGEVRETYFVCVCLKLDQVSVDKLVIGGWRGLRKRGQRKEVYLVPAKYQQWIWGQI